MRHGALLLDWLTEFTTVTVRMAKEQALPVSAEAWQDSADAYVVA